MRLLLGAMFILPIAIASPSLSFAATSAPAPGIQAAADPSASVDKKTYLETQTPRMAQWRQDIAEFNDRVETKTTQVGQAAKLEIASAWSSVERASAALGATGDADWAATKANYESAVGAFEATWAKFDPTKKM